MADNVGSTREVSLIDTMERIRAEQFPHLDREIVRELLRLHADQNATPQILGRAIDEAIGLRTGENS